MTKHDDQQRTVIRAIQMPVFFPNDADERKRLDALINRTLDHSRRVANIVQAEMYRATVAANAGIGPDQKPQAHDGEAAKIGPRCDWAQAMYKDSAGLIVQEVRKRWRGKNSRGHRVWWAALNGLATVPDYRSVPYPVRARNTFESKAKAPHLGRGGELFIWLPLVGESGTEWTELQLQHKAKRGDRRAYQTIRAMIEGDSVAETRQVELYRRRNGKVMVKVIVKMPAEQRTADGDLIVRTRPDALLVASTRGNPKDWRVNADQVQRFLYRQTRKAERDQRKREDAKAARRRHRAGRGPIAAMQRESAKHFDYVQTELHKISRDLIRYAQGGRRARIIYDDSVRDFAAQFPWADLAGKIKYKAEGAGIEFVTSEQALAEKRRQKAVDEMHALEMQLQTLLGDRSDGNASEAE